MAAAMTVTPTTKPILRLDFQAVHTVYKNARGERIPGVTTVLGLLNKPALLRWAWKMGRDGLELDSVKQGAADIGTVAHALCEAHLRGMTLDRSNVAPATLGKAETGFLRFLDFWQQHRLNVVHTELAMVSERMQVGGTLDVLAERGDPDDASRPRGLVLVDLKTSKGIYDEMLLQAATYAAIFEEVTSYHVDEVYVVRIGKEDADDLEVRLVNKRPERVAAFAALAEARRALQATGYRV